MIIDALWRKLPGRYFCISTKSASGKWVDHFFEPRDFGKIRKFLKDNEDKDVYFCPHGFSQPRRVKEFSVRPKMLWADLDEADPRKIKPKPTIAIESSPGRYVGLWLTNWTVTDLDNKRMSYHAGADHGGWDYTQVLRVPSTFNYKYNGRPRVRVLWDDGPTLSKNDFEAKVEELEEQHVEVDGDYFEVLKRYERALPPLARQRLRAQKVMRGEDRSEVLYFLEHECLNAGMTIDETFLVLKHCVYNKFEDDDDKLMRDIERASKKHVNGTVVNGHKSKELSNGNRLMVRSMDEIEFKEPDWLWYPYLARGEITLLEGDPGLGKSYLAQMIGLALADGLKLPSERPRKLEPMTVLYFDIENSVGSVTKARLTWNNLKNGKNYKVCEEAFTFDNEDDFDDMLEWVEMVKPSLVVFDTVNTYLGGKVDINKGNQVRALLTRVRTEIAARFNCAVLILRHLVKNRKGVRAIAAGQGSIDFVGLARVVVSMGRMPEEPSQRGFAIAKSNIGPDGHAQTVNMWVEDKKFLFDWGDETNVTADDLVSTEKPEGEKTPMIEKAKEWLETFLDNNHGEMDRGSIMRAADKNSFDEKMIERAARELNVKRTQSGFGKNKQSVWALPD